MFKILKNVFLNNFIVTKTSGSIPPRQGPSSLLTHRSSDTEHSLQYRTSNFRNIPTRTNDDDKRRRPPIKIFNHNPDCESLKKYASTPPYIATEKNYIERKLQKQFILPTCFPTSIKKESINSIQNGVSSKDLLSYCLETSITSSNCSRKHSPTLLALNYRPLPQRLPKYSPYPPLLCSSCSKPSPPQSLKDFPEVNPSLEVIDVPVYPPCPSWATPSPTICPQPCNSLENMRLFKLPLCPPPCPPESLQMCPPPSLNPKCYKQPRECTPPYYPPVFSPSPPHSGSRPRPQPCEF